MKALRALLCGLALCLGWAGAHGITFSQVDIQLDQATTAATRTQIRQTHITVQLPISALLSEEPSPLPAGTTDAALRARSLPAPVRTSLTALLRARLHLQAGVRDLPLTVSAIRNAGDNVALTVTAPPVTGALSVRADLFPGDDLHKVFVNIYRGAALAGQYALDHQSPALTLAAPVRPLGQTVLAFVKEGVVHIFTGPDHILFVLALLLLGGRLWAQVKIITAFTVAHSITLTLAALQIVQLPSRLVESVIALSIVVVGLHDLRQLRAGRLAGTGRDPRVLLAFAFGLVHGFGFASVLTDLDLPRQALAWSLAAFNAGVELGQVTIVLLATPVLLVLRRAAPPRLAQGVLTLAAAFVVLMGGFWLCQRVLGA